MQDNNEARAMEIAYQFANNMGMANWEPQSDFVEALAYEIAAAMEVEENEGVEATADLIDSLQLAAQRIRI